eukprot:2644051-Rhodomonas_salina.4
MALNPGTHTHTHTHTHTTRFLSAAHHVRLVRVSTDVLGQYRHHDGVAGWWGDTRSVRIFLNPSMILSTGSVMHRCQYPAATCAQRRHGDGPDANTVVCECEDTRGQV